MTQSKKVLFAYCVLSVLSGSFALVQDARSDDGIRGRFRLIASGTCTESIGGFTTRPTPQPLAFTVAYHEVFSATAVFVRSSLNWQGVRGTTMFDGPSFPSNIAVGSFAGNCALTFDMTGPRSFKAEGSCAGTLGDGPAAGQNYSSTGMQLEGAISRDGDIITLAAVEPVEQQISLSGGYSASRYCIHTMTLIRQ